MLLVQTILANKQKHNDIKSWILLALFWYLLASLSVPSLMGSSLIALLTLIVTIYLYHEKFIGAYIASIIGWILFVAPYLIGTLISSLPDKSLIGLYDAVRAIALFYSIVVISRNSTGDQIIKSAVYCQVILAATIFIIFIVLSFQSDGMLLRHNSLLLSNIGNLHEFANLASICLLVLLCLYVSKACREKKLIVAIICMFVVIAATFSKSNYISIILCIGYLFLGSKLRRVWYLVIFICVMAYIYFIFLCVGDCGLPARIKGTLLSRQGIYGDTLSLVSMHPWFGYGINTFKYSSGIMHPSGVPFIMPHNIYLEQLYSWGVFGVVSFYLGLTIILSKANHQHYNPGYSDKFLETLGHTLLIYCFSRGFLDFKFFSFHYLALIIFSLGLVLSRRCYSQSTAA